jgi:hypothetical protein
VIASTRRIVTRVSSRNSLIPFFAASVKGATPGTSRGGALSW